MTYEVFECSVPNLMQKIIPMLENQTKIKNTEILHHLVDPVQDLSSEA